jgi:hypothetical protein
MTKRTSVRATLAASVVLTGALGLCGSAIAQPSGWGYPGYPPAPVAAPVVAQPQRAQPSETEGPVVTWDPLRFAITAEGRTTWPIDGGAQRLAGQRSVPSSGVSAQADVLHPWPKLTLRADAGWVHSSTSSLQAGSGLEESVKTHLFFLGASLRYDLLRWLAPFARASVGLGWDKLWVAQAHDRDVFEQGSAGAGLFLRTPGLRLGQSRWSPTVGGVVILEGGYTLATGSDFVLHPSLDTGSSTPIPAGDVALGQVGRSAPYFRLCLGLGFGF